MKATELEIDLIKRQGALMETDVARIARLKAAEKAAVNMDALGAVLCLADCIVPIGRIGNDEVAQIYIGVLREKLLEMSQKIEDLEKSRVKFTQRQFQN